jgi:hypothetical protein
MLRGRGIERKRGGRGGRDQFSEEGISSIARKSQLVVRGKDALS